MKKLIVLFLPLLLFSCGSSSEPASTTKPLNVQLTKGETNVVAKNNDFATKMFANLCSQQGNDNVTFSPLSMEYLLAMVANGASSEPLNEMLTVMGFDSSSLQTMNNYYRKMTSSLALADPSVDLSLANSAWIQDDFTVKSAFTDSMKSVFNADVNNIDFTQTDAATNTINEWCGDKTAGMIKKISLDITPDLKLVLANASYFKGEWTYPFDKDRTFKGYFNTASGTKSSVDMMYMEKHLNYGKQSDYQVVELPYGNQSFSMLLVLPSEGIDANSLVSSVPWDNLTTTQTNVALTLPKFTVENHWKQFDATLRALGINQIMDNGSALDNIADNLCVSKVTQDVCMEVNEEGTKAAAVSAGGIVTTSVLVNPDTVKVTFDRPFLLAIRENSTGTILFMGKISNL